MVNGAETIWVMSIAAAAILLAQAATAQAAPAPVQTETVQATASVRVLRATKIDLNNLRELREANVQVRRNQAGTVWIEFS